jgi:4-aminobutyrate aminotransferase-like enzyme
MQPNIGSICGALATYKHIEEWNLLDKVHWIQPQLSALATNLMEKEIITDYKTSGTVLFMTFRDDIRQSGMSKRDTLRVCAPLIADDEYFETIYNKIIKLCTS